MAPVIQSEVPVPNTLGIPARSSWGVKVTSIEELKFCVKWARDHQVDLLPVGSGSNLVPQDVVEQFVVQIGMPQIEVIAERSNSVLVRADAGVNWHAFVCQMTQNGWYGIENLALIPGLVGATPIQNVGAYGVEVAERIVAVHVLDKAGDEHLLQRDECEFEYRASVFQHRRDWIVTAVEFELLTQPNANLSYPALQTHLASNKDKYKTATPLDVLAAVCEIRKAKLPDPDEVPNAGSFFKNPIVSPVQAEALMGADGSLSQYPEPDGKSYKFSAAQLLDRVGARSEALREFVPGVACWDEHALVLVNPGRCSHGAVMAFAAELQRRVQDQFNVELTLEPRVV